MHVRAAAGRAREAEAERRGQRTVRGRDALCVQHRLVGTAVDAVGEAEEAVRGDLELVGDRCRCGAGGGALVRDLEAIRQDAVGVRDRVVVCERLHLVRARVAEIVGVGKIDHVAGLAGGLHGKVRVPAAAAVLGVVERGRVVVRVEAIQLRPGDVAGATQADAVRLVAGSRGRVVARVQEVAVLVDAKAEVRAGQAVVAAPRGIRVARVAGVVVGVRAGVAQAAAVGTDVVRRVGAVHQEERETVRAIAARAARVTGVRNRPERHLQASVVREGEVRDDRPGLVVAVRSTVGHAQGAIAGRIRQVADHGPAAVVRQPDAARHGTRPVRAVGRGREARAAGRGPAVGHGAGVEVFLDDDLTLARR